MSVALGRASNAPIFNAAGNHDYEPLYTHAFGQSSYRSFRHGSELFVILNTELSEGQILGEQHDFLMRQIERVENDTAIRNLFIFSHRLIWAIDNEPISQILPYVNGPDAHPASANGFSRTVLPTLRALRTKNVFPDRRRRWYRLVLAALLSQRAKFELEYIATGIGDTARDMLLEAHIDRQGSVSFENIEPGSG